MNSKRRFWVVLIASVVLLGACKSEDNGGGGGAGAAGASGTSGIGMAGQGGAGSSGGGAGAGGAGAGGAGAGGAGAGGAGAGGAGAGGAGAGGAGAGGMSGSGGMGGAGTGGAGSGGPLTLTSSAVEAGGMLPMEHRCVALGGETGPSPQLSWTGGPTAMSYALTMTDKTAGFSMDFAHWTIYDIPASVMMLPEGVPEGAMPAMPAGAKQSPNQSSIVGGPGYFGPCGTGMVFTYEFELHAIDVPTLPGLTASSTAAQVRTAITEHSLGSGKLSVMSEE